MYRFTLSVADLNILCTVNYEYSPELCKDYLSDGPEDFSVTVTADDIASEIKRSDEPVQMPNAEPYIESLALYRKICSELAFRDTVLIHGSSLMTDGRAVLFCAPSGTGKSTHARLWRKVYKDRIVMINDDKPLVRMIGGIPMIYGTPWNGKHHLGSNICAPLKDICFLSRGEINTLSPVSGPEAATELLRFTFRPDDPLQTAAMLDTSDRICRAVNFWRLSCNMDPEAAKVSYEGIMEK